MALIEGLVENAQRLGQLDPAMDPPQLAFELYAPLELANYLATLHRDPAIVERGRSSVRAVIARTSGGQRDGPAQRQPNATASRSHSSARRSGPMAPIRRCRLLLWAGITESSWATDSRSKPSSVPTGSSVGMPRTRVSTAPR